MQVHPPSTRKSVPVIYDDASEDKKSAAEATSLVFARRFNGTIDL